MLESILFWLCDNLWATHDSIGGWRAARRTCYSLDENVGVLADALAFVVVVCLLLWAWRRRVEFSAAVVRYIAQARQAAVDIERETRPRKKEGAEK